MGKLIDITIRVSRPVLLDKKGIEKVRVRLYNLAYEIGFIPRFASYGRVKTVRVRYALYRLRRAFLNQKVRLFLRRQITRFADWLGGIENGRVWEKKQMGMPPPKHEVDLMVELLNRTQVDWLDPNKSQRDRDAL